MMNNDLMLRVYNERVKITSVSSPQGRLESDEMKGGPHRQAKLAQVVGDHDLDPLVGDGGDEADI